MDIELYYTHHTRPLWPRWLLEELEIQTGIARAGSVRCRADWHRITERQEGIPRHSAGLE